MAQEKVYEAEKTPSTVELDVCKSDELGEPPNGGFQAWAQVLAAFSIFLNTWCVHSLSFLCEHFNHNSLCLSMLKGSCEYVRRIPTILPIDIVTIEI